MRHRGPDDFGEWWSADSRVGLGHARLAIIDLSPAAHQPMRSADSAFHIVFNGEIYNFLELRAELSEKGHTFFSKSDTEVLLAAYREWGTECLGHLNGAFAFALYDSQRQRLFMARDRAGEKPLFYTHDATTVRFASELKGIMADPTLNRRIDAEALDSYLTMGFVPGERCILHGVKKLPPAHALVFNLNDGTIKMWRYWQLPQLNPASRTQYDDSELLEELEVLLEDSVHRQMLSDVPVGILLSGGVDSSLVTAMAARSVSKVRTFTVRFPGHGNYDETKHARLVAKHFDTDQIELDAAEFTVDSLPMLAKQFDEPIVDSSLIPTHLVSRLVRQHCTVALGGDGGDELFGGYSHYSRLLQLQRTIGRIPNSLRRVVSEAAEIALPVGLKGRNWLQGLDVDFAGGLPRVSPYFDRRTRAALMEGHPAWQLSAEAIRDQRVPKSEDILQRSTRMDFENYLPEDILVKVDRASLLNSLEVRAPFLDYRIINFAYSKVPSQLKATIRSRKVLLKKLAGRLMPPAFDLHRKQGFSVPLASWLRLNSWHHAFREVLLGDGNGIFNKNVTLSLLDGQLNGRANSERLFSLVMFELWRREYGVSL
jgi:asparagine synthase (glutamine-hydrolysing)